MATDKQKQSIPRTLIRMIFILLALLPFLFGTLAAMRYYSGYGRNKLVSLVPYMLLFVLLLAVLRFRPRRVSEPVILLSLFATAVAIRAVAQAFFNTQPISDYMDAINAGIAFMNGPARSVETARFPYWGFYRITLGYLFRVFGNPIQTTKVANLLLSGLTADSMYWLGKKILGSRKFGFIAASIFIFNPANILYINLPTGEHIFILLFPLAAMLFLAFFNRPKEKTTTRIILALVLGILLGLMDMFKPVAIILIIAMLITVMLTEFFSAKQPSKKRREIWMHVITIAIMLVAFFATKQACFSALEYYAQIPPNRYGTGWTLRVGLDMENQGRVSSELAYTMHMLYSESGEDYRAVNARLMDEALASVKGVSPRMLLAFMKEKFDFTWQSNQDFYNWATNTQMDGGLLAYDADELRLLVDPINDAFLLFSLPLSAAGALYCVFKRDDKGTLVVGLFILGFTLLLFVTEVQQRYRSVLASSIPFFAAYGMLAVNEVVSYLMERFHLDRD